MRLLLLAVGKPRHALLEQVHDDYAERIRALKVAYASRAVPEAERRGRLDDPHVVEREGRALLAALPEDGTVIALDRAGEMLDSPKLARKLAVWAAPAATFAIGGPLGLGGAILDRADAAWSLSRLTFPHELARVLVAEQLYRALTILRGLPYHK